MQNFKKFLSKVEKSNFPTLTSEVTGVTTIQQTKRNELRSEGLKALKADLEVLLAPFEVLEVPNGLVIVAENEPGDFTFS